MRLTANEKRALDTMHAADERYDGEGVVTTDAGSWLDGGQAWVNWRTARSLERKRLADIEHFDDAVSMWLTTEGTHIASNEEQR